MWLGDAEVLSVILINLLPHREAARKRAREAFYAALGLAALVGLMIAGGVYFYYQAQIADQQARNLELVNENKRLDTEIKDIASLQSEITALKARQQAVEDLQADRNLPVQLLNEVIKQLPAGIFVKSIRQDNQSVLLDGMAQSPERVAELLRNLLGDSTWLTRPDLNEVSASPVSFAISPKDNRRVFDFSLRMALARPVNTGKIDAAASASAPAAASGVSVSSSK
jgi:type IV pilus assembly protein PilN